MSSKMQVLSVPVLWSLLLGVLLAVLFTPPTAVEAAPPPCTIRVESNSLTYTSLQAALNAATDGDLLRVSGTCTGTSHVNGLTQAGYITRSITIRGGYTTTNWLVSDPIAQPSVIDANGLGRGLVISSTNPIHVVVDSLALQNGYVEGYGGGVFITNTAVVTLHQTTLRWHEAYWDSSANGLGGAIYNGSHLTVTNSTLDGNYAEDGGGAIWGGAGSHTYLHNSTVANNFSWGALESAGTLSVTFSTIINNGGGGLMTGEIANSILVGNEDFGSPFNCGGGMSSTGHNVLGSDCTAEPTDLTFTGNLFADLLNPLDDNGGPTLTYALYPASIARGWANPAACPATDQRGEPRVASACDAGSFQLITYLSKGVNNVAPPPGEVVTYTIVVQNPLLTSLTSGVLSDTLPAGVALAGTVSLLPPSAGTVGGFPEIVTGISLNSGERLTVTFPVTVTAGAGVSVVNTAVFTATNLPQTQTAQALLKVSNCYARLDSNGLVYSNLQTALDEATSGDTVRVAGVCDFVQTVSGTPQVGYIAQDLTLRGGYTTTNWVTSDPIAHPTLIDAGGHGRGLRINSAGMMVSIENLTIRNGDATGLGGAQFGSDGGAGVLVQAADVVTLTNVHLHDHLVGSSSGNEGRGTAVASDNATLNIINSHIYDNRNEGRSAYGGALFASNGALNITNSRIYQNQIDAQNMDGSPEAFGGGVYVDDSATLQVVDSHIYNNSVNGQGGGVAVDANATITVTGSAIYDNSANQQGGGLYLPRTTAVIEQSRIHNNTVYGSIGFSYDRQGGGGLYISSSSDVTIRQTLVASNTVFNRGLGGGIAVNCVRCTNTIVIENSTLSGNTAREGGGGFSSYLQQSSFSSTDSNITLNHVSIINNNATSGNGHAINQERETANLSDVSDVTASFSYQNSLIAGNGGANECRNSATHDPASLVQASGGYNLFIAGAGCTVNGTTDQTVADQATLFSTVVSATLSDLGGNTLVHALNASGTAVDAIPNNTNGCVGGTSVDQRGAVRAGQIVLNDGRGGTSCDIGAHEGESSQTPMAITLTSFTHTAPSHLESIPFLFLTLLLLTLTSLIGWLAVRRPATN